MNDQPRRGYAARAGCLRRAPRRSTRRRHLLRALATLVLVLPPPLSGTIREITYLPQIHRHPTLNFDEFWARAHSPDWFFKLNTILRSQLGIGRYLASHRGAVVFDEGACLSDYFVDIPPFDRLRPLFPRGLPESVTDLDLDQRRALYEEGGARVAFALGFVKSLRKTLPLLHHLNPAYDEVRAKYDAWATAGYAPMPEDVRRYAFDECEAMAINEIFKAGLDPDELTVLVFGQAHRFEEISVDGLRFRIPSEFDCASVL